jgi:hypothetical protein
MGERARERLLIEYYFDRGTTPEWASTRTRSFQYTEYYAEDGQTVGFREFYDLSKDPWQLHNLLADGDPSTTPDVDELSEQLRQDRHCRGAECP